MATKEQMTEAIESLNKAFEVLASAQGLGALSSALTRAGCQEYCGSYDGCTGYCKPMGAAAKDLAGPVERIEAARLPFAQS